MRLRVFVCMFVCSVCNVHFMCNSVVCMFGLRVQLRVVYVLYVI